MNKLPVKFLKIVLFVVLFFIITITISVLLGITSAVELKGLIYLTKDYDINGFQLFFKILFQNVVSFLLVIISGILIGLPLVLLTINAHFFISQIMVSTQVGVPAHILMLFTVPHSIIEFSVLIIATSLGLYIPFSLFSVLINNKFYYFSKINIQKYINLIIITGLFLIPAAIIETGMIELFRAYF